MHSLYQDEWLKGTANSGAERQADGRVRRWARVLEMESRALRVTSASPTPDTALVEFADGPPVETRELDESIYLALDADGHI